MNECDFCGDEFDYSPSVDLARHDLCVCEMCEDMAKEQLELSSELEDEEDENDVFENNWF